MNEKLTAVEARKIANCQSRLDKILIDIEKTANNGEFEITYYTLTDIDIDKLKSMGYKVEVEPFYKGHTISWK